MLFFASIVTVFVTVRPPKVTVTVCGVTTVFSVPFRSVLNEGNGELSVGRDLAGEDLSVVCVLDRDGRTRGRRNRQRPPDGEIVDVPDADRIEGGAAFERRVGEHVTGGGVSHRPVSSRSPHGRPP